MRQALIAAAAGPSGKPPMSPRLSGSGQFSTKWYYTRELKAIIPRFHLLLNKLFN